MAAATRDACRYVHGRPAELKCSQGSGLDGPMRRGTSKDENALPKIPTGGIVR